jgi:hypothetical protein
LQDTDELLLPAVVLTLNELNLGPEHAAAARLARRYADVIDTHRDQAWAMRWIGPLLLDCLESLGATPVARGKVKEGRTQSGPSRLTALREARRA